MHVRAARHVDHDNARTTYDTADVTRSSEQVDVTLQLHTHTHTTTTTVSRAAQCETEVSPWWCTWELARDMRRMRVAPDNDVRTRPHLRHDTMINANQRHSVASAGRGALEDQW
jgi:hypothetical protein